MTIKDRAKKFYHDHEEFIAGTLCGFGVGCVYAAVTVGRSAIISENRAVRNVRVTNANLWTKEGSGETMIEVLLSNGQRDILTRSKTKK